MNEPVFVILAAGMGSRFGGLKQITPVDDEGHMIIDFSLFDARRAGFKKVVFIIKHQIEEDFKAAIGRRIEQVMDVSYVYQELDELPRGYTIPEGREKPWGTAHALMCAQEAIDGDFCVLNADDYYGPSAIASVYNFLCAAGPRDEHAMVGYLLKNTVTENGYVSRGVCRSKDGYLDHIEELTHIEKRGDDAAYTKDGSTFVELSGDSLVSMNLWGLKREILDAIAAGFPTFLDESLITNPLKGEYLLPTKIGELIDEGCARVKVIPTRDVWHGVTYSEDLQSVKDAIAALKASGLYPKDF